MKIIMKLLLSIVACICVSIPCLGHDASGHQRDWKVCLGIDVYGSKDLNGYWNIIQSCIDDYSSDYQELRERHPWFNFTSDGHRLLFHWGMNNLPIHHEPLLYKFRENLKFYYEDSYNLKKLVEGEFEVKNYIYLKNVARIPEHLLIKKDGLSEELARRENLKLFICSNLDSIKKSSMDSLFKDLSVMQQIRNKKMIDATLSYFWGDNSSFRRDAAALATLVYDIHILGDYSDIKIAPLQRIDGYYGVFNDIIKNGLERILPVSERGRITMEFKNKAYRAGETYTRKAERMLNTLKEMLPQILWHERHQTLERYNIRLIKPKEMYLYPGDEK